MLMIYLNTFIRRWYHVIHISAGATHEINSHLSEVYDWLLVNKLSLNIKKTNYIVLHAINKNIEGMLPELSINGIITERVQSFNFLGLFFNEHVFWKPHIDIIANKLMKFSCILNKLKRFLPSYILRTLYFSMVQSRLTYSILGWGFEYRRFVKLQKRFLRIISLSTYNAHTEPLFKNLEILTIKNLFDINYLKFVYNYKKWIQYKTSIASFAHSYNARLVITALLGALGDLW